MRALSECEAAVSDPLALEVTRSTRHVADSKAYLTVLILGNHLPAALGCVQSVQKLVHSSTQQRCSQLSGNLRYTPLCQQRSLCVQFCSHANDTNLIYIVTNIACNQSQQSGHFYELIRMTHRVEVKVSVRLALRAIKDHFITVLPFRHKLAPGICCCFGDGIGTGDVTGVGGTSTHYSTQHLPTSLPPL